MDIHFISAGAGSGKTYTLTETLYQKLTKDKVRPAGVIATTFTKKAAAELRERVRESLIKKGNFPLANAMSQARIGTVNSVCGQLVQRFAFALGLPPELEVIEEGDAQELLRECIDREIDANTAAKIEQLTARLGIEDWQSEVRTIIDRVRANAIDPATLPACAAQNAQELLAHFPKVSKSPPDAALIAQIHSTLAAIALQQSIKYVAKTKNYEELLRKSLRALQAGTLPWSDWVKLAKAEAAKPLAKQVAAVQSLAGAYDSHPLLRADISDWIAEVFAVAERTLTSFAAIKRERRVIDFVDQEQQLLRALDRPDVSDALRGEIDLLMVDEFQDTSPIQLALFAKLAQLAKQTVWVGDLKQAIYGFRGSDITLMQAVLGALPALGAKQSTLPMSYRSRPELVALVNQIFVPAFAHVLTPEQISLTPARPEQLKNEAFEWWQLAGKNKAQIAQSLASGVHELLTRAPDILDKESERPRKLRAGDIAILARKRANVTEAAAALTAVGIPVAVAQAGLLGTPEATLAMACLRRLHDRRDTLASAEIIQLTECSEAEVWLKDRLNSLAASSADSHSWREQGDDANTVLATLAEMRREARLQRSPAEALRRAIIACDLPRYLMQWGPDPERGTARLANLAALQQLADDYEASCHSRRIAATLPGLLIALEDAGRNEQDLKAESGENAVRIMTHHAAKGLEWPVVLCLDLHEPLRDSAWGHSIRKAAKMDFSQPLAERSLRYWPWPWGLARTGIAVADTVASTPEAKAFEDDAREEAKRLLYVSMTRARDLLIFAVPDKAQTLEWLNTLDAKWLCPTAEGKIALPAIAAPGILSAVRAFDGGKAGLAPPECLAGAGRWFARPGDHITHLPAFVSPSTQALTANTPLTRDWTSHRYGSRISITGSPDMAQLGEALHACLAFQIQNPALADLEARLARILSAWKQTGHVAPRRRTRRGKELHDLVPGPMAAECLADRDPD